jgi:hypothetical protein
MVKKRLILIKSSLGTRPGVDIRDSLDGWFWRSVTTVSRCVREEKYYQVQKIKGGTQ